MLKQVLIGGLATVALILLATGCQQRTYYPDPYASDNSQQDPYGSNSSVEGEKLLRELEALVARNPSDFEAIEAQVYEIEALAPDTHAADSARRILEEVRADYDALAERKYKTAIDKVRDLADDERFNSAICALEEFVNKYPGSSSARKANEERFRLAKANQAKGAYDVFVHNLNTFRSVGEYERALEYAKERKPANLKDTPYEERLRECVEDLLAETQTHKNQKAREDALPWENIPGDGGNSWQTHGGTWQVEGGRVKGINQVDRYGRFMVGEDNWKDYVVDMQFTLRGGVFALGLRGLRAADSEPAYGFRRVRATNVSRTYITFDVCSGLQNADRTIDMKVTVRGNMVIIQSPSLPETRYRKEKALKDKHTHGPICIFLKRGAQVEFTRLRVKHISKVAEPTVER